MRNRSSLLRAALAGAALLTLAACNSERDPANVSIQTAYALPITPDPLGGAVPDRFRIYANAWETGVHQVRVGDSFRTAVNIGTQANISKYGGMSGIRFTIISGIATSQQFNFTAYLAESEPLEISCNEQNKLRFTVTGDSEDNIEMRVKTAAMPDHRIVRQNGHPAAGLHGWNPAGSDYSYKYSCLVERQP